MSTNCYYSLFSIILISSSNTLFHTFYFKASSKLLGSTTIMLHDSYIYINDRIPFRVDASIEFSCTCSCCTCWGGNLDLDQFLLLFVVMLVYWLFLSKLLLFSNFVLHLHWTLHLDWWLSSFFSGCKSGNPLIEHYSQERLLSLSFYPACSLFVKNVSIKNIANALKMVSAYSKFQ